MLRLESLSVLEVMQFARDAYVAERWMIAQEPQLKSENVGVGGHVCVYDIYNCLILE